MLISHKDSAYVDNDELERAAGMLEQHVNSMKLGSHETLMCRGAAIALRLMHRNSFRHAEDLLVVFQRCIKEETHEEAV